MKKTLPIRLQGLDASKKYRVTEINLMTADFPVFTAQQPHSRAVEVAAE